MRFFIEGYIVPYTRISHMGKNSERAKRYYASQNSIKVQLKNQMQMHRWEMLPEKAPLVATIAITVPDRLHCSDIDNLAKAILDAAQGIVFKNDLWIDSLDVYRELGKSRFVDFIVSVCLGMPVAC